VADIGRMRTARFCTPGLAYHCIWRFVDRDWFFESHDERANYLRLLGHAFGRTDWRCLAYALMSNHIHVAAIAGRKPMASWTRAVNSPFANWMNRKRGRLGPLFADRSKDFQIRSGGVGEVIAYIHNNPVRAGVVARARHSDWTSHRAYAGLVEGPAWLAVDEGLARSGFDRPREFDAWVDITPGESAEVSIERFKKQLRRRGSLEPATPTKHGDQVAFPLMARRHFFLRPSPARVIELVAELCDEQPELICSRRRLPRLSAIRVVVAHCASSLGITPTETASALGISCQAVSSMLRREVEPQLRGVLSACLHTLRVEFWNRDPSRPPLDGSLSSSLASQ